MTGATLVNTQTHGQLLTGYTLHILWQLWAN